MNGKLIRVGMEAEEARKIMIESGRFEYIASGNGWFWMRSRKYGDVLEIQSDDNGIVIYVDVL